MAGKLIATPFSPRMFKWAILSILAITAQAGTIVWDGSFNNFNTVSDFEKCMPL